MSYYDEEMKLYNEMIFYKTIYEKECSYDEENIDHEEACYLKYEYLSRKREYEKKYKVYEKYEVYEYIPEFNIEQYFDPELFFE